MARQLRKNRIMREGTPLGKFVLTKMEQGGITKTTVMRRLGSGEYQFESLFGHGWGLFTYDMAVKLAVLLDVLPTELIWQYLSGSVEGEGGMVSEEEVSEIFFTGLFTKLSGARQLLAIGRLEEISREGKYIHWLSEEVLSEQVAEQGTFYEYLAARHSIKRQGKQYRKMALAVGLVSPQDVNQTFSLIMKRGQGFCSYDFFVKLAAYLQVPPLELIGRYTRVSVAALSLFVEWVMSLSAEQRRVAERRIMELAQEQWDEEEAWGVTTQARRVNQRASSLHLHEMQIGYVVPPVQRGRRGKKERQQACEQVSG